MQIEVFCMQISGRMKKMQFHYASCQRVEKVNENLKKFKVVRCPRILDIVSILNGHIHFCGGQVLFDWHIPFGGSTSLCFLI
jgi:hypothetical protein